MLADPADVLLEARFAIPISKNGLTKVGNDAAILVSLDEASPASIHFVRGDVKITIFGEYSNDVLHRVADSIP